MSDADITLEVHRIVPASPERTFAAWTTADELAQWWTPPGGRCVEAAVELRVGGRYRIVNEFPDGTQLTIEGEYLKIDPARLLRFTWSADEAQPATEVVTIVFAEHPDGTELNLTHTRIPSEEALAGHRVGWEGCIDGLESFIRPA